MSKKGFEIVDHYQSLLGEAIAKRLGVSTKLFESVELEEEELREDDRLGGSKHKTDIVPDAGSMNHRAATGGSTGWGDEVAPSVNDKGSDLRTNQKMRGNKQGRIGLEEAEYGYLETQEVGHDAKQGKQKPVQSIDDPKNGSAASPNLVNKGPNTHKEDGMLEEEDRLSPGRSSKAPKPSPDVKSRRQRETGSREAVVGGELDRMHNKKVKRLDSPDLEENVTQYGYDAKQEVGHDAKQGKQKPMQSIDEPTGVQVGSKDPGLRNKGGNTHKEDGLTEGDAWGKAEEFANVPEGASWEETTQHLEKALAFYKSREGRLNQTLAAQMERALKLHNKSKSPSSADSDPNVALNEAVNKLVKSVSKFRKARGK